MVVLFVKTGVGCDNDRDACHAPGVFVAAPMWYPLDIVYVTTKAIPSLSSLPLLFDTSAYTQAYCVRVCVRLRAYVWSIWFEQLKLHVPSNTNHISCVVENGRCVKYVWLELLNVKTSPYMVVRYNDAFGDVQCDEAANVMRLRPIENDAPWML